jgi:nicotinamidase-related amidase
MAMNELDLSRAALLTLDFQNYGVHPQGYWASHGEPDWSAIARPAVDTTAKVLAAVRRHRVLIIHVGLAWRPGNERDGAALRQRRRAVGGGQLGIGVLFTGGTRPW